MSTENKLVKTAMDSAVIVGLAAGVGYLGKKVLKENCLFVYLNYYFAKTIFQRDRCILLQA